MNDTNPPRRRRKIVRVLLWSLALGVILLAVLFNKVMIQFHRAGLDWAYSQRSAEFNGEPKGFIRENFGSKAIEDWRYHRDALVKWGGLVHRQFRFGHIRCPSDKAQWMQEQFFAHQNGSNSKSSTSGRGHDGEYAVNLWCAPEFAAEWDEWFNQHDGPGVVERLMAEESAR